MKPVAPESMTFIVLSGEGNCGGEGRGSKIAIKERDENEYSMAGTLLSSWSEYQTTLREGDLASICTPPLTQLCSFGQSDRQIIPAWGQPLYELCLAIGQLKHERDTVSVH